MFEMKIKLKNGDLEFNPSYMSVAKKNIVRRRLDIDSSFAEAWNYNYSGVFYMDMLERMTNQRNVVIRLYGATGSGKSRASIYLTQLFREHFDFGYHVVFSKTEAATLLASETYKAKNDELAGKFTILLDEDYKRFGVGSVQEEEYFQSMQEFLRRSQINMIMNNPYDVSGAEIQLETIGYTYPNDKGETFTKSICYYLTDSRNKIYSPMGYILTKRPNITYDDAYEAQKTGFLKHFGAGSSPVMEKNKSLLDIIYNTMPDDIKQMVREALLLGKENDARTLISQSISQFNLPTAYNKQLTEAFKFAYFKDEVKQSWERKKQRLEAKLM